MKAILRSAVLAAGVLSTLAMGTSANAAPAAVVFTGSATIDCFGCGTSAGRADLSVTGTHNGSVHADFTADEPGTAGVACVVTGTARGRATGAGLDVDFNWTRVGAAAVITLSAHGGGGVGAGVSVFAATGVTCGAAVTATVAGAAAGDV